MSARKRFVPFALALTQVLMGRFAHGDEPRIFLEDPPASAKRACSFESPICVGASRDVPDAHVVAALGEAERVFFAARSWFDLPVLPLDATSRKVEIRLVAGALAPNVSIRRRSSFGGFDRASGFVTSGDGVLSTCAGKQSFASALFRLFALGTNPAANGSSHGIADALASTFELCGRELVEADPRPKDGPFEDAALPIFLDDSRSDGRKRVPLSILALAPTRTAEDAFRWSSEPDLVDVFRESAASVYGRSTGLSDTLVDFFADEIGRGRLLPVFRIPFPERPRKLLGEGLLPGGAGLIRIEAPPKGARLRIETEWEAPAAMTVATLATKRDGSRRIVAIPSQSRATSAQGTVVDLDDCDYVDVLVIHGGEWYAPFDPDVSASRRSYAVSVARDL